MDIQALTLKITSELETALSNMSVYLDDPLFKITTVNAKVGQMSDSIASVDDLAADVFSKENGWIVDFEFQPTLKNTTSPTNEKLATISTLPWFDNLPLEAIKGIGDTWRDRFINLEIITIGDLLVCQSALINTLVGQYDSVEPIAFKRMTELLDVTIPLSVFKAYSELTLADLINNYTQISDSELEIKQHAQLTMDFINNCLLCIDQKYLTNIILR